MDTCGTLGSLVVDQETGERLLLSNWHVLPANWSARVSAGIYRRGQRTGGECVNATVRVGQAEIDMEAVETGGRTGLTRGVDIAIEHRGVAAVLRRVSILV